MIGLLSWYTFPLLGIRCSDNTNIQYINLLCFTDSEDDLTINMPQSSTDRSDESDVGM